MLQGGIEMARTIFDINKFSERLRILMEEHGLNTYTLAEAVYLTPATISRYLNGKMEPKRSSIEVIASYFNVNPAWLMGADVDKYLESQNNVKKIPILGTIAAGAPILAEEYIEGYEYVPTDANVDFCLRVKGDSMINARIFDGDIVYIRKQPDVENGEIAAVIIDREEATLKRVYKIGGNVILRAENPKYKDLVFSKKDAKEIKIIGKAVFFKSEVR